jgi:hypothetical protein
MRQCSPVQIMKATGVQGVRKSSTENRDHKEHLVLSPPSPQIWLKLASCYHACSCEFSQRADLF